MKSEFLKLIHRLHEANVDPILIPIKANSKEPDVSVSIKENLNKVRLTPQEAINRIEEGKNVGIYAFPRGLCFVDIESDFIDKIDFETFTVKTRDGGRHYYFLNPGIDRNYILKADGKKIGELRANWQYVLTPGSYVPSEKDDGYYRVVKDLPIARLDFEALKRFIDNGQKEKTTTPQPKKDGFKNVFGISLKTILKADKKLRELLETIEHPDYPSRSEADFAAVDRLWYWGFSENDIKEILRVYRPYEKTERDDYLIHTIEKAISSFSGERFDPSKNPHLFIELCSVENGSDFSIKKRPENEDLEEIIDVEDIKIEKILEKTGIRKPGEVISRNSFTLSYKELNVSEEKIKERIHDWFFYEVVGVQTPNQKILVFAPSETEIETTNGGIKVKGCVIYPLYYLVLQEQIADVYQQKKILDLIIHTINYKANYKINLRNGPGSPSGPSTYYYSITTFSLSSSSQQLNNIYLDHLDCLDQKIKQKNRAIDIKISLVWIKDERFINFLLNHVSEMFVEFVSSAKEFGLPCLVVSTRVLCDLDFTIKHNKNFIIFSWEFGPSAIKIADLLKELFVFLSFEDSDELYYYHPIEGVYLKTPEKRGLITVFLSLFMLDQDILDDFEKIVTRTVKTYSLVGKKSEFLSKRRKLIAVKNGVIDLEKFIETGKVELLPFSPRHFIFNKLPVEYNPNATCPRWDSFLLEVLPNEDYAKMINELLGYCLWPDYEFQYLFVAYGDGQNGKSKCFKVFEMLLGKENVANLTLTQLEEDRFSLAEVDGKLVNIGFESDFKKIKFNRVKSLTGGDHITVERKFEQPYTIVNTAKIIIICNRFGELQDVGYAEKRRLFPIPFPFTIENPDPMIEKKFVVELSGILNRALEGLYRLMTNGRFSVVPDPDESYIELVALGDSVARFVKERIEEIDPKNDDEGVEKEKVYTEYMRFCKDKNLRCVSREWFFRKLRELVNYFDGKSRKGPQRIRKLYGIRLKSTNENDNENESRQDQAVEMNNPTLSSFDLRDKLLGNIQKSESNFVCVCGEKFDNETELAKHQANCAEFQRRQNEEACNRLKAMGWL